MANDSWIQVSVRRSKIDRKVAQERGNTNCIRLVFGGLAMVTLLQAPFEMLRAQCASETKWYLCDEFRAFIVN